MDEHETAAPVITGLADDFLIRAIIVNQGIAGGFPVILGHAGRLD